MNSVHKKGQIWGKFNQVCIKKNIIKKKVEKEKKEVEKYEEN